MRSAPACRSDGAQRERKRHAPEMAHNLHSGARLFKMPLRMRRFLSAMALASLLLAAATAKADELSDLAAQVRTETLLVEQMTATHGQNLTRYEQLAAAIRSAKRAGSLNPVATATLQADLRLAHEQAEVLQRANGALMAARQRLDAIVEQYRESLLARVDTLQFELRQPARAPEARQELQRITEALQQLAAPLPPMSASPVAAILQVDAPTPEQLHAASLELQDHSARLERQLGEVRERITTEEQQGRLQARLRAMASNDALFEDGFGGRGRAPRGASRVMERAADSTSTMSDTAAPEFGGLAADSAGAPATSAPITSAPGGQGGRVALGGSTTSGPVANAAAGQQIQSRTLVELRGREAALLKRLEEARRAQQRLAQATALLRQTEAQER